MSADLFDTRARALRRDRAAVQGPELFLYERVFEDCLERVGLNHRSFRSCLLLGCPDRAWPHRLGAVADTVHVAEPGARFAEAAGGAQIIEDEWVPTADEFDLCVAIGTLDSVNGLPRALQAIRRAMKPQSLFIGAIAGGETLPRLRVAMHAADQVSGAASPHIHPRIEPAALAALIAACGFARPVVDVERVRVGYKSFARLVQDLRRMGATNVLNARSRRPLSRSAAAAAAAEFERVREDGRTVETFEILHFAAWTSGD